MIETERGMFWIPKGGHPALKIGCIEASNVECSVACIDVDLLASWHLTLSYFCGWQRGYTNTVHLRWQPGREKSGRGRALRGQMHRIELQIRKG